MAEKDNINQPKSLIEPTQEEINKQELADKAEEEKAAAEKLKTLEAEDKDPKTLTRKEKAERREKEEQRKALEAWIPKTELGKLVKAGKEKDLDKILSSRRKILEPEILDTIINLQSDLIEIGQAKGKFGGGKRRAWRQTQKKTKEGNVLTFSAMAVVGDQKGHIGIGYGKAKETLPSRSKALRMAKLNLQKITLGYESKESGQFAPHTVPFVVEGKCGSVRIKLMPAPRGTGLVVGDECKKILKLAGVKDVYSKTSGHIRTTFNLAKACVNALSKTNDFEL